MGNTRYEVMGVSMLPSDWEVVDFVAQENNIGRSAAVRTIVRSYPLATRLISLGQALALNVVTQREAMERLNDLVSHMAPPDQDNEEPF